MALNKVLLVVSFIESCESGFFFLTLVFLLLVVVL